MAKKPSTSRTRPGKKRGALMPARPGQKVTTWLLTVDGAKAQLYSVAPLTCRLTAVPDGAFKQANKPSRMLISDRPGHSGNKASQRRHAMELRSDPHDMAETAFVKKVAMHINGVARQKLFDRLIVAAPPRAMSELRATINSTAGKKVALEITHEWTKLGVREMATRLKALLGPSE